MCKSGYLVESEKLTGVLTLEEIHAVLLVLR